MARRRITQDDWNDIIDGVLKVEAAYNVLLKRCNKRTTCATMDKVLLLRKGVIKLKLDIENEIAKDGCVYSGLWPFVIDESGGLP